MGEEAVLFPRGSNRTIRRRFQNFGSQQRWEDCR